MSTLRAALRSMSYTEGPEGLWRKPVGFHLFAFVEVRKEWSNWFLSGTGKNQLWKSETLADKEYTFEEIVGTLKYWEAYTRIDVSASAGSQFHLDVFLIEL